MEKKKLRPKGCKRTLSGRHLPEMETLGYTQVKVFCRACGLIDDTGAFTEYLFPGSTSKKIDDTRTEGSGVPK